MCRDILNTCIRNTEEAERNSQPPTANSVGGRGQGKGIWGMIEESKLAKTFRKDGQKKVESCSPRNAPESLLIPGGTQNEDETIAQAQRCKIQLEEILGCSTPKPGRRPSEIKVDPELIARAKALLPGLAEIIQTSSDSTRVDELLGLNDALTSLLARATPKPRISLQGLGIKLNGLETTDAHEAGNGSVSPDNHVVTPSGDAEELADDDALSTPRIDKGKGKAPPEPEVVESVLSPPGFAVMDSEEEEEAEHGVVQEEDDPRSPTDRYANAYVFGYCSDNAVLTPISSRSWVAEEGEIFRKGNRLLGPEEMEGEYDGEELRIEVRAFLARSMQVAHVMASKLLEAEVERPPPRAILDDLSLALDTSSVASPSSPVSEELPKPLSPLYFSRRPSPSSVTSPTQPPENDAAESPSSASPLSPLPRPHVSRHESR
jgi:protein phosphatase 1 regulatory subunit 37